MPSTITISEINQLIETVNAGDISSAYEYLIERGYSYASWTNGVAQADTIAGVSALNYLSDTALQNGEILTDAE